MAPKGFFVCPYFLFKNINYNLSAFSQGSNSFTNAVSFGVGLGYQLVYFKRIVIDFMLGAGPLKIVNGSNVFEFRPIDSYKEGISPQIGISVGVSLD